MDYRTLLKKKPEEVAKEFEAIFIKEILKEAFKPMLKNKDFTTRMYYDSFLEGVSEKLASAGGIGLARFILREFGEYNK